LNLIMKTWQLTILALAFAALAATVTAERASAGDFSVRQCLGASFQDFFGTYDQLGGDRVDVVSGCAGSGANKVGVYQDKNGSALSFGTGGQFLWNSPFGVAIWGTAITGKMNDENSIEVSMHGASSSWPNADLDQGYAHDGVSRTMSWTNRSQPVSLIVARLSCRRDSGCSNEASDPKAYFEITDLEFKTSDTRAPTLTPSGVLWDLGATWKWHRGSVGYQVNAQDVGAGIARSFLLINNLRLDLPAITCPADKGSYSTSFTPCPASVVRSGSASTSSAPFQEGVNLVRFCTEDFAIPSDDSNRTCSATKFAFVDNVAPTPPQQLTTVGGSGWRSTNGFEVVWQNPDGQRSPINEADYRVVKVLDGTVVESGTVAAGTELGPIDLPAPGEYRVEVSLRDSAGNTGSSASTILRFDDGRPGDVAPEPAGGWISSDELPLEQSIERAEAGGPSGVEGYAIEISRDAPSEPCPDGACSAQDLTLASGPDMRTATIVNLAEGSHWISAVASSGARLASGNVGVTQVKVDKTVPEVILNGVPGGWVNQPVTLTAIATDSGSGMVPRPDSDDGQPVTVIRAGDDAPYASPGNRAAFTVASEGTTSIAYWARDLAGNTNDGAFLPNSEFHPRPGEATIRIDRVRPTVTVQKTIDPEDPELITATARDGDSGLAGGAILIRETGGQFRELETVIEGSLLSARIPSDSLTAGKYELKAEVRDRAGNSGSSDAAGVPVILNLPLKQATSLTFRFSSRKAASRSAKLGHGKATEVSGQLLGKSGKAVSGARILLEQSFSIGSRKEFGVSETRTDGTGRFAFNLGPGPSRSLQVRYPGSRTNRASVSRGLSLVVADRITFRMKPRVLRNGGRALMTGSIRGKGALRPARGKLVAIQYFDPSRRKWRPVEVLRARRNGRFAYQYRFRTIALAQRIIFRAVSLPEAGWPFRPSTSKRRSVIVYPKD